MLRLRTSPAVAPSASGSAPSDDPRTRSDRVMRVYGDHEDSVYSAEWSTADPWVFASLSYDGRLVIHHVPRDDKFKILL